MFIHQDCGLDGAHAHPLYQTRTTGGGGFGLSVRLVSLKDIFHSSGYAGPAPLLPALYNRHQHTQKLSLFSQIPHILELNTQMFYVRTIYDVKANV